MSRNAAAKGKLQRFSDLLDKRNSAISKVQADRSAKDMRELNSLLSIPKSLRPDFYSPEASKLRILGDRVPYSKGWTDTIIDARRNINSWNNFKDVDRLYGDLHLDSAYGWKVRNHSSKAKFKDAYRAYVDPHLGTADPWTVPWKSRGNSSYDNFKNVSLLFSHLNQGTAGPWVLKDLARYGSLQNAANKMDKATFPL